MGLRPQRRPLFREGSSKKDFKQFPAAVQKDMGDLERVVFKDLEAVETPDEHTAVFRFAKPTPFQLIRNALPALAAVVPKHVADNPRWAVSNWADVWIEG